MTLTGAAVPDAATPASPRRPPVPEWRVAAALAHREAIRLTRASIVPLAVTVLMNRGFNRPDVTDLRAASYNMAFPLLLLAAVVLVVSHRAVTRSRRDGSEELFAATPASPRARTAAHLLAVLAPTTLAGAAVAFFAWEQSGYGITVGSLVPSELAVGPLLVAGAGCLGVLLARVWPQDFTPYLACVAIAGVELGINIPRLAGSGARWLAFWVEGSLWWVLPRHSTAHFVYLVGLVAMAAVGALLRHGTTRRLALVGVVSIAVTAGAAGAQMRQPQDEWRRANAMFATPASVQTCFERDGVRYCVFEQFAELANHFEDMVDGVRAEVPPRAWPDDLAVTQRVTALDLQYVGDMARWVPHLPDIPQGRIRQPDDGEIHPGVEFGWAVVQESGFGVQVASSVVGLPLVPNPEDGSVCVAAGQARAVIALWAGAHATDDAAAGLEWLTDQAERAAEATGVDPAEVLFPVAEVDVYSGFAVSLADARLALRLLDHDDTAGRVAQRWELLTDPATTSAQLVAALGIDDAGPLEPPRDPFMAHPERDIATIGPPCR